MDRRLPRLSRALAGLVVLIGSVVLAGWAFDIAALKGILPHLATMKANTALAFCLAGAASWTLADRRLRVSRYFAAGAGLIAAATLYEYVIGRSLGIDQLLFADPATLSAGGYPGRMAPVTAINFLLLSVALLSIDWRWRRGARLAQILTLIVAFLSFIAMLGYAYGIASLYTVPAYGSVALHTALTFLLLAIGILCARPKHGFMARFTADDAGGLLMRRLLPAAILVPPVLGWLRLEGQRAGLYGTEFGLALFATSNIIVFSTLVWLAAGAVRKADERLRLSQKTAVEQERLRALGQMAAGMAHDINNALSPAMLYTDSLLGQRSGLSTQERESLGTVQEALDDIARTVGRLRDFSRPREPQLVFDPVDVNRIAQHTAEFARARWSSLSQQQGIHIEPRLKLAPGAPQVSGAEHEIRDALAQLIFNAVDAMPAGGTLTVRTRIESRGLVLEVIDTGTGMTAETRRRCLEPFFTTRGERGSGLGLAMVFGMAQRHGAQLEIDSVWGHGTTVRLAFPEKSFQNTLAFVIAEAANAVPQSQAELPLYLPRRSALSS